MASSEAEAHPSTSVSPVGAPKGLTAGWAPWLETLSRKLSVTPTNTAAGQPKGDQQYVIGKWTDQERDTFVAALETYGADWKESQKLILARTGRSRSLTQIRTHAQKFFRRIKRERDHAVEQGDAQGEAKLNQLLSHRRSKDNMPAKKPKAITAGTRRQRSEQEDSVEAPSPQVKRPRLQPPAPTAIAHPDDVCSLGMSQIALFTEQLRSEFEYGQLSQARPSEPRPSLSELNLNVRDSEVDRTLLALKAGGSAAGAFRPTLAIPSEFPTPRWLSNAPGLSPKWGLAAASPRWLVDEIMEGVGATTSAAGALLAAV